MKNLLKVVMIVAAVGSAFPVLANGSMGIDVKVIEVKPSPSIIYLGQERRQSKERVREIQRVGREVKQEIKREERARQKELARWNKEQDKRMHRERFKPKKGR